MSTVNAGQRQEDPTRKQRREQARTRRRALEQARAASAVKRARLALLAPGSFNEAIEKLVQS
jgi:hypothetical protein